MRFRDLFPGRASAEEEAQPAASLPTVVPPSPPPAMPPSLYPATATAGAGEGDALLHLNSPKSPLGASHLGASHLGASARAAADEPWYSRLDFSVAGIPTLFGILTKVDLIGNPSPIGSPLWAYFEFQRMLTHFWVFIIVVQAVPTVFAAASGLWHEHPDGSYHSLFIDAWSLRNDTSTARADHDKMDVLRWLWRVANDVMLLSALLLVARVRALVDWRTTPSLRYLLDSRTIAVTFKDDHERAPLAFDAARVGMAVRLVPEATQGWGERYVGEVAEMGADGATIRWAPSHAGGPPRASLPAQTVERQEWWEAGAAPVQLPRDKLERSVLGCEGGGKGLMGNNLDFAEGWAAVAEAPVGGAGGGGRRSRGASWSGASCADVHVTISPGTVAGVREVQAELAECVHSAVILTAEDILAQELMKEMADQGKVWGQEGSCWSLTAWQRTVIRIAVIRVLEVILFVGMVVGTAYFVKWLTNIKTAKGGEGGMHSTAQYAFVSLILVVVKPVFEKLSAVMGAAAYLRNDRREAAAFVHRLAFKVVVLIVALTSSSSDPDRCREGVFAGTLFIYMLIDYVVGWILQFVIPTIFNLLEYFKKKERALDADEREPMVLHEEYLDIAYNQFVLYLAVPVFPCAAVMGLLFNVIEGRLDHWKISSGFVRPPGGATADAQITMVATAMSWLVLIATAAPGVGIVHVLAGYWSDGREGEWGACPFP